MKVNKSYEIDIKELGANGEGIAKLEGFRVLVPKSLAGERVKVLVKDVRGKNAKAAIEEVLSASPTRIAPFCKHFEQCGGCQLQHLNKADYTKFKQDLFEKAVGMKLTEYNFMSPPLNSRVRTNLKLKKLGRNYKIGYFEPNSHNLVEISECAVLRPEIFTLIAPLRKLLPNFDPKIEISEIIITLSNDCLDVIIMADKPSELKEIELCTDFAKANNVARISWDFKKNLTEIVKLKKFEASFGNYLVEIAPNSFMQSTEESLKFISEKIVENITEKEKVIDLYSGCGSYSFSLVDKARSVVAVEGSPIMVEIMKKSINFYNLHGKLLPEKRDLFLHPYMAKELSKFDAAIINPPRNGAEVQAIEIAASKLKKVIMVSCNPQTFARDFKHLSEAGFKITKAYGIDQFLMTHHLELLAIMER